MSEGRGPCGQHDGGQVESDEDQVGLRDLRVLQFERLLDLLEQEGDESVEALAHALEHDDAQRDARDGVEHAEDLAAHCLRRAVAVPCTTERGPALARSTYPGQQSADLATNYVCGVLYP